MHRWVLRRLRLRLVMILRPESSIGFQGLDCGWDDRTRRGIGGARFGRMRCALLALGGAGRGFPGAGPPYFHRGQGWEIDSEHHAWVCSADRTHTNGGPL